MRNANENHSFAERMNVCWKGMSNEKTQLQEPRWEVDCTNNCKHTGTAGGAHRFPTLTLRSDAQTWVHLRCFMFVQRGD